MGKKPTIEDLYVIIEIQQKQIIELRNRVQYLEEELNKHKTKKNSNNSSIPPSQDQFGPKKNQSLREKTGRKVGGQKGHKGHTLEMTKTPDEIIKIEPDYCQCCGVSLDAITGEGPEIRQVVDIPPIRAIFTEYRAFKKTCKCGHRNVPDFPQGITAPVSYGQNIEGLIGYFHARQYLPFSRMQEMFNDIFNIDISEGGIHCLLNRFAEKVNPLYQTIKQRIESSKVIGTDETGGKVNGDKHWFWTWQTPKYTYIAHSNNRGSDTINLHFPQGFPNSTLVHDGWRAQLNTTAQSHQTCLSHLQRHLKYLNQLYDQNKWGKLFLQLLYDSIDLEKNMTNQDYYTKNKPRDNIMDRFDKLLGTHPDKKQKELYTFYKRMLRERNNIFTFLFIPDVPPDNNASERAIRNIKVKQKISGQFKIEAAAQNFAKIRSVIDTTIKNGLNIFEALSLIAKFDLRTTD